MKLRFLVFVIAVGDSGSALAQSRNDRTYVSETIIGDAKVAETGRATHTSMTEVGLGTPPLRLGEATMIFGSLYGRKTWIAGADPRDGNTLDMSDIGIGAVLITPIAEHWTITVGPSITLRSTFESRIDFFHDASLSAIAIANYAVNGNRNFVLSIGAVLTNTLPFAPGLPIGGLIYRNDHWRVDVVWPYPQTVYMFNDRFEVGAAMRFDYPLYRVPNLNTPERADYVRSTNHFANAIFAMRLVGDMWLSTRAGIVFGRVLRLADEHRQYIDADKQTLGTAPFVGLVLSYRRARPTFPQQQPPSPPALQQQGQ